MLRSVFTLIRLIANMDQALDDSLKADTWLAPILAFIYITLTDIVPTTAQTSSMLVIFGNKRHIIYSSIDSDFPVSSPEATLLLNKNEASDNTATESSASKLRFSYFDKQK